MKKSLVLFPRQTWQNESDNKRRLYYLPDALARVVGQAKTIRYQLVGYRIGAGAEVRIYMFETPYEGMRSNDLKPGSTPFHTIPAAVTTLRSDPVNITGPFSEFVTIVLEIKHGTDSAQVEWDGLVAATLILEE